MDIRTVGVLGCGLMGSGIAQVSAGAGYRTIVREVNDTALQAGLGRIRKFLSDGVAARAPPRPRRGVRPQATTTIRQTTHDPALQNPEKSIPHPHRTNPST